MTEEHKFQKSIIEKCVPELRTLYKTLVPSAMTHRKFWLLYFILTVDYTDPEFEKPDSDVQSTLTTTEKGGSSSISGWYEGTGEFNRLREIYNVPESIAMQIEFDMMKSYSETLQNNFYFNA